MMSVVIYINELPILIRRAQNISEKGTPFDSIHTYVLEDGTKIKHRRSDGPAKLAIKMLKKLKETA